MDQKRRKLNKNFEKKIYSTKKNVELILAKIYDIDEEEIQKDYMNAFNNVIFLYEQLKNDYEYTGYNEKSEELINNYNKAFTIFNSEFEI